ncbi:MAG: hypothetical protein ACH350_08440 [Parachlamydiaceae bacterium]
MEPQNLNHPLDCSALSPKIAQSRSFSSEPGQIPLNHYQGRVIRPRLKEVPFSPHPLVSHQQFMTGILIEKLSASDQEKYNQTGTIGFLKTFFWRPISFLNTEGCQETILVHIKSATKQLSLLGIGENKIAAILNNGTLFKELDLFQFERALEGLKLEASEVGDFDVIDKIKKEGNYPSYEMAILLRDIDHSIAEQTGPYPPLMIPTEALLRVVRQLSEKASQNVEIERKWKKNNPHRNLETELSSPGTLADRELDKIKALRTECETLTFTYQRMMDKIKFLQTVQTEPAQMDRDPIVAARVHHILHDMAQEEIAAGNSQTAFEIERHAAEAIPLPSDHPLHHMQDAIEKGTAKQFDPRSGAYFSSLGTSALKGGHLHACQRMIDGEKINIFDFKISHYARDELTDYLQAIIKNPEIFKASLPHDLRDDFEIREGDQKFNRFDKESGQFTRAGSYHLTGAQPTILSFGSIGKIIIGNEKQSGCLYNKIVVEMAADLPEGQSLLLLHRLLTVAGIGPILTYQPPEIAEKMKLAQLLRAFYPALGVQFDVTKEFYDLPIEELKKKMIRHASPFIQSQLKKTFKKYLDESPELMKKIEIAPGKEVWGMTDLGEKMKEQGAWGLMTGIGASRDWEKIKGSIERLLTEGALSSTSRFDKGEFKIGASLSEDMITGGGDEVFTRLINDRLEATSISNFPLFGQAQILWDLDSVVQRVPYAFKEDQYGIKNRFHPDYGLYKNRSSLISFARSVDCAANEVMVKNTLDPSHIAGIVVESEKNKEDLIDSLVDKGIAKKDPNGLVYLIIKEKRIELQSFIHVGNPNDPFKKEWWG